MSFYPVKSQIHLNVGYNSWADEVTVRVFRHFDATTVKSDFSALFLTRLDYLVNTLLRLFAND